MSKFTKAFLFASIIFAPFVANAVTVASWGGAYTESQKKAYADTLILTQVQLFLKTITVV